VSEDQDAQLTRELEALVAAKAREQSRMRLLFGAGFVLFVFAVILHRHPMAAIILAALSIAALAQGVRHHLRASALRGQAMEKILAEAFRRAGQEPPSSEP
jgi:hypothetical protein